MRLQVNIQDGEIIVSVNNKLVYITPIKVKMVDNDENINVLVNTY